ncbi:MAG: HTH domain-containing protein [Caldilinea sp. CFX5]|nr:HTH domain-containing protein [Caldilinea sp. CFX5]
MRADRLLSIVLLLQREGKMTADNLARQLEVSRRTILRDVEALSFAGIPLYTEGGHGGGIALDEKYRTTGKRISMSLSPLFPNMSSPCASIQTGSTLRAG